MKRAKIIFSALIILFTLITIFENSTYTVTGYKVDDTKLPAAFNNFKIVQISDLHDNFFDRDNHSLLNAVKSEKPDIIVITGDFVDKNSTDISSLLKFAKTLSSIAPCYFITGNHEAEFTQRMPYNELLRKLNDNGIITLDDDVKQIVRGDQHINIAGLSDPLFQEINNEEYMKPADYYAENYRKLDTTGWTVLLAHRPYEFETFASLKANLVLSGHEHGGQIRIPFLGGVFAPGEGFFPKYDSGVYRKNDTTMVVSRGLGNSVAPIRINNTPELTVIELSCGGKK